MHKWRVRSTLATVLMALLLGGCASFPEGAPTATRALPTLAASPCADCSMPTPTVTPFCPDCGESPPTPTSAPFCPDCGDAPSPLPQVPTPAPRPQERALASKWSIDAVLVTDPHEPGFIYDAGWVSNTVAYVMGDEIELPADPAQPLTSLVVRDAGYTPPGAESGGDAATSPDGLHRWECAAAQSLKVLRTSDGKVAAVFPWTGTCPPVDASAWSPDSARLAILLEIPNEERTSVGQGSVFVLDLRSIPAPQWTVEIQTSWGGQFYWVEWLTSEILSGGTLYSMDHFRADSGRFLAATNHANGAGAVDQPPILSHDGSWVAFDYGEGLAIYDQVHDRLYEYWEGPDITYKLEGWAPDDSSFFAVSRPPDPAVPMSADARLGILEFDPSHPGLRLAWPDAVEIEWDEEFQQAFILQAEPDVNHAERISGAVWELATRERVAEYDVGDPPKTIYGDPIWYMMDRPSSSLIPIAWSASGSCLAFGRKQGYEAESGSLVLVGPGGSEMVIAERLERYFPENMMYAFAPDGRHLLAVHGPQAWIARIPIDC